MIVKITFLLLTRMIYYAIEILHKGQKRNLCLIQNQAVIHQRITDTNLQ